MLKIGIAVFPGSNCDKDVYHVISNIFKIKTDFIWHTKEKVTGYDAIIIPGGFSYGDRLRAGIIAAHSPIIREVKRLGKEGTLILGICNGFQILVESELLPGALITNESLKFVCKWTDIQVKNNTTPFTNEFTKGQVFKIPLAHGEGRYVISEERLKELKKKNQIVFSYQQDNPNGSFESIAGVCNEVGNVMGMMPHPERACQREVSGFGLNNEAMKIFESLINYLKK
ncbi:MAG TPA: phosphoribosylformylglycinamidine synthase subunit PurQ [Nitrososphaeraceae archaeon]|nr:phosphoribosylformylglycinamidine synthase subunit PurQ [Nitrososphaeraceae archaeon]